MADVVNAITAGVAAFGLILTGIGLLLARRQLELQNRQRRLELGSFYIARYWELDDALLLTDKKSDDHRRHRHRYLRLCEDEYDAARLGWLDAEQWGAWHKALVGDRTREMLRSDLAVCDPDKEGFSSLRACLGQIAAEGRLHSIHHCTSGPHSSLAS